MATQVNELKIIVSGNAQKALNEIIASLRSFQKSLETTIKSSTIDIGRMLGGTEFISKNRYGEFIKKNIKGGLLGEIKNAITTELPKTFNESISEAITKIQTPQLGYFLETFFKVFKKSIKKEQQQADWKQLFNESEFKRNLKELEKHAEYSLKRDALALITRQQEEEKYTKQIQKEKERSLKRDALAFITRQQEEEKYIKERIKHYAELSKNAQQYMRATLGVKAPKEAIIEPIKTESYENLLNTLDNLRRSIGFNIDKVPLLTSAFNMLGNIVEKTQSIFKGLLGVFALISLGVVGISHSIHQFIVDIVSTTEKVRGFNIALQGLMGTQNAVNILMEKAFKVAEKLPLGFTQIYESIKAYSLIAPLRPMLQDTQNLEKNLMDLNQIVTALAQIEPEWGIQGAIFSLREALSGDLLSLKRRFEIPVNLITTIEGKRLSEVKNNPPEMIKALARFLSEFYGPKALEQTSKQISVVIGKIFGEFDRFKYLIGQAGIYDYIVKDFIKAEETIRKFVTSDIGREIAIRISNVLSYAYDTVIQGLKSFVKIFNQLFKIDINFDNINNGIEILVNLIEGFVIRIRALVETISEPSFALYLRGYVKKAEEIYNGIKNTISLIIDDIGWLYNKSKWFFDFLFGKIDETTSKMGSNVARGLFWLWFFGPINVITLLKSVYDVIKDIFAVGRSLFNLGTGSILIKSLSDLYNGITKASSSALILKGVFESSWLISASLLKLTAFFETLNFSLGAFVDAVQYLKDTNFGNFGVTAKDQLEDFEETLKEVKNEIDLFNKDVLIEAKISPLPTEISSDAFTKIKSKEYFNLQKQIMFVRDLLKDEEEIARRGGTINQDALRRLSKIEELIFKLRGYKKSSIFAQASEEYKTEADNLQKSIEKGIGTTEGFLDRLKKSFIDDPLKFFSSFSLTGTGIGNYFSALSEGCKIATEDSKKLTVSLEELLKTSLKIKEGVSLKGLTEERTKQILGISEIFKSEGIEPILSDFFRPFSKSKHGVSKAFDIAIPWSQAHLVNQEKFLINLQNIAKQLGVTKILLEEIPGAKMWDVPLIKSLTESGKLDKEFIRYTTKYAKPALDETGKAIGKGFHIHFETLGQINDFFKKVLDEKLEGFNVDFSSIYNIYNAKVAELKEKKIPQVGASITDILISDLEQTNNSYGSALRDFFKTMDQSQVDLEHFYRGFLEELREKLSDGTSRIKYGSEALNEIAIQRVNAISQLENNFTKLVNYEKYFKTMGSIVEYTTNLPKEMISYITGLPTPTIITKEVYDNLRKNIIDRSIEQTKRQIEFFQATARERIDADVLKRMGISETMFRGGIERKLFKEVARDMEQLALVMGNTVEESEIASRAFARMQTQLITTNDSLQEIIDSFLQFRKGTEIFDPFFKVLSRIEDIVGSNVLTGTLIKSLHFIRDFFLKFTVNPSLQTFLDKFLGEVKRRTPIEELTSRLNNLKNTIEQFDYTKMAELEDFIYSIGYQPREIKTAAFAQYQKNLELAPQDFTKSFTMGMKSAIAEFKNSSEIMYDIGKQLVGDLTSTFETGFFDFFTHKIKTLGDLFKNLGNQIRDMFLKIIAKLVALSAIKIVLGVDIQSGNINLSTGGSVFSNIFGSLFKQTGGNIFSNIISTLFGKGQNTNVSFGAVNTALAATTTAAGIPSIVQGAIGASLAKSMTTSGGIVHQLSSLIKQSAPLLLGGAVVSYLTSPGRLFGGTVKHTAEAQQQFASYNEQFNEYLKRRLTDFEKYIGSSLSNIIANFTFASPQYWETKSGNGIFSKKTVTGHVSGEAFMRSVKEYYDLLYTAAREHYNTMRLIDNLREKNELAALVKEKNLREKQSIALTKMYQEAIAKSDFKLADELREKVLEMEDSVMKLADNITRLSKETEYKRIEYEALKKMYQTGNEIEYQRKLLEISKKKSDELEKNTLAWYEAQIELMQKEKDITDTIKNNVNSVIKEMGNNILEILKLGGSVYDTETLRRLGSEMKQVVQGNFVDRFTKITKEWKVTGWNIIKSMDFTKAKETIQQEIQDIFDTATEVFRFKNLKERMNNIFATQSSILTNEINNLVKQRQRYEVEMLYISDPETIRAFKEAMYNIDSSIVEKYEIIGNQVKEWLNAGYITSSIKNFFTLPIETLNAQIQAISRAINLTQFTGNIFSTIQNMTKTDVLSIIENVNKVLSTENLQSEFHSIKSIVENVKDPFTAWFNYSKTIILNKIRNAEEGSIEYFNAQSELFDLFVKQAEQLKSKAEETNNKMLEALNAMEETLKLRMAEERKSAKGDTYFIDFAGTGLTQYDIKTLKDMIKNNDPRAAELLETLKRKMWGESK